MRRFVVLLVFSLSGTQCGSAESNLRAATPNYSSSHQRRELSAQDWWYTLLNKLHVPCPPGSTSDHPKGHCAHPSHPPPPSHSDSHSSSSSSGSSNGGGGGGGGGSSSSSNGGSSSKSSGCSDENGCWNDDGWKESALDNGNGDRATMSSGQAGNIAAFLIGAMVAAMIGAAFMVSRKVSEQEEEEEQKRKVKHPLKGVLKNRMKAFPFRRKKKGMLDDDVDEGEDKPGFVEISNVRSGASRAEDEMSVKSGRSAQSGRSVKSGRSGISRSAGSYKAPQESVISGFDNDDSDEEN